MRFGTISEYTASSRTRRAISWAYWAPKSTTSTACSCAGGAVSGDVGGFKASIVDSDGRNLAPCPAGCSPRWPPSPRSSLVRGRLRTRRRRRRRRLARRHAHRDRDRSSTAGWSPRARRPTSGRASCGPSRSAATPSGSRSTWPTPRRTSCSCCTTTARAADSPAENNGYGLRWQPFDQRVTVLENGEYRGPHRDVRRARTAARTRSRAEWDGVDHLTVLVDGTPVMEWTDEDTTLGRPRAPPSRRDVPADRTPRSTSTPSAPARSTSPPRPAPSPPPPATEPPATDDAGHRGAASRRHRRPRPPPPPATAESGPPPPPATVTTGTANEFLPDRDLDECVSALPQPDCGSESRGGWRQVVDLRRARRRPRLHRLADRRAAHRTSRPGRTHRPMTPDEFRRRGHELIDWIADYVEGVEQRPVAATGRARRRPRPAAGPPAGRAGAVGRRAGRPRRRHRAGHRPLAAPELLRLLPVEHVVPVDPRRAAGGRARRAGDELGDVAGVHRARDADARLDGRAARPARALPLRQRDRRRGDPGLGQRGDAGGDPRRPAGGRPAARSTPTATRPASSPTPRRRPTRASRRACASPASAPTACASSPTTTPFAMRPEALAAAIAADRAAGLVPFFVCATHGTTSSMAFDPTPAIGDDLPASRACGCTSTRR